ncbi:MAG TPA: putative glycoside hydrolase [Acidimicrobiales bacterium]|nr:putative glycoside hydrolase [Acidimicrobiales bacterium]
MPTDLLKIPGVQERRRLRWPVRGRDRQYLRPRRFRLRLRRDRRWARPRSRRVQWSSVAIGAGYVALALYMVDAFWSATRVQVTIGGIGEDEAVTSQVLAQRTVTFAVEGGAVERATLRIDGVPVDDEAWEVRGSSVLWRPGALPEGDHEVVLSVPRPGISDSRFRRTFAVDDTPPAVDVAPLLPASGVCDPVTVRGRAEPGSAVTLDGEPLGLQDGAFTLDYDRPPATPLHLAARDAAGNRTEVEVIAPVAYPGGQGVHVTAAGWGYEPIRQGILGLVDAGLVSAVELDLKDEGGIVGYDSQLPLAIEAGSVRPEYRLEETVSDLKRRGVRVIGRIVAFRDPALARWAWANGRPDWVVQTPAGDALDAYGGFTNFAHPDVRRYNIDIALEAAGAGIDDILWDYVRRPEGDPATMVVPGMQNTTAAAMVEFLAAAQAVLRERCVYQGASVFGIAADRPDAVGQDVPHLARHVDYLAPMLYPSHWVPGEYRVANPNRQPFDIVKAALADFQAKTAGTGTALVPWLQDFTLGHPYGPAEVRAQIDAARELGVSDWLLWNPGARYTSDALDPALVGTRR